MPGTIRAPCRSAGHRGAPERLREQARTDAAGGDTLRVRTRLSLLALPTATLLLTACGGPAAAPAPEPATTLTTGPSATDPAVGEAEVDPCGPGSTLSDEEIAQACPEGGEAVAAEGSVTVPDEAFVVYPDGMRSEIVSVSTQAPSMGNNDPAEDTEVLVTVRLSNIGSQTLPLWPDGSIDYGETLLYGANRYTATRWFSDQGGTEDAPQQLVPGTDVDIVSTFTLPGSELGTLAFTTNPNSQVYTAYTFTDVQTLLG